jgi:predicted GNAT family acetyltransferase
MQAKRSGVKRSASSLVATVLPLTARRWPDLLNVFGPGGACFGCWCQYWRMPRSTWRQARAADNRAALEQQARSRQAPGLIGYTADHTPVGWVSLGPRKNFPGLRHSRFFGDTREEPGLWSIVCFFVPAAHRGAGVAESMLAGAVAYAEGRRARVLEAYPWDLGVKTASPGSLYVGTFPMFAAAGFKEVSRRVPHRPVVQLRLR